MSHRSVELIIGRLATDEGFRRRFEADPVEAMEDLRRSGWELTAVEVEALRALDLGAVQVLAAQIDARLVKVEIAGATARADRGPSRGRVEGD
jgi:hypothetical protein